MTPPVALAPRLPFDRFLECGAESQADGARPLGGDLADLAEGEGVAVGEGVALVVGGIVDEDAGAPALGGDFGREPSLDEGAGAGGGRRLEGQARGADVAGFTDQPQGEGVV